MNDVAYALRQIARRPAVSIVVIVMLAIGIGSTTSMFSLFEVFLLRPLPVADPDQLVNLNAPGPKPGSTSIGYSGEFDAIFSYPMFRDLEAQQSVFRGLAALVPRAEIEGEMGEPQMGLQARLMSQALRKLTANIKRSNTLVIFINQIRMKIGVMFGNPETTTGGNALKFYASVRIDIRRIGAIKKGDEVIGSETRAKVVKNKVAPPFRNAEFDILYGQGISREGEIIELGVLHKIVEKSGAWYSYGKERIGQGKDNTRDYLREHADTAREIEAKIRAVLGVAGAAPAEKAEAAVAEK
jgi:hypothetical protein